MFQKEFDLYLNRANLFFSRLSNHYFYEQLPVRAEMRKSRTPIPIAERRNGQFKPIAEKELWGGPWESAWFHIYASVPESWLCEPLALRIALGGEGLLLDPDGIPYYGLSAGSVYSPHFRKEIFEIPTAWLKPEMEFWVEAAANGLFGIKRDSDPELDNPGNVGDYQATVESLRIGRFNRELFHLKLDLEVLLSLLKTLPPRGRRTDQIVLAINRAANVYAEKPENAVLARRELAGVLNSPACGSAMYATAVGHAHIDTAWLWPVRESIRKCARTFASQLRLLEEYPDYVFGASAPQHYKFIKEYYPALYDQIKVRVAEGRWELQGGMWVEADCNLISGESMIRQFLHGKNFFRDEFGVEVRNLWIPDVFGYAASMPQIMAGVGCDYLLTQKLSWSQFNQFPYHTFRWRGIDGSVVLAHFPPENNYNAAVLPEQLAPAQERFHENALLDEFLSLYGIGDGGGGPKAEYIERGLRMRNLEGVPKFRFGRADEFFERLKSRSADLPLWSGELYLELHRGTLTTQARTKKNNRKLEQLLAAAEFLNAQLPLASYPLEDFDRIWKTVLLNQFHDILPGSSIREVYETTEREHSEALEAVERLINQAGCKLAEQEEGALFLVNSLSIPNSEVMMLPKSWGTAGLVDEAGRPVACQIENGRVQFRCTVPPLGSRTLRRNGIAPTVCSGTSLTLENEWIRYDFNEQGELLAAFDKELNRNVMGNHQHGNELNLYVDRSNYHEAWDIDLFYKQQLCGKAETAERPHSFAGPVRSGIEFRLKIGESSIVQKVFLTPASKRLDFETRVDWREARKLLRVLFPIASTADEAAYDIPYGYLRRPLGSNTSWDIARFEVAGQRYADLSDAAGGAALLNDCKYGYSGEPGLLSLTLLRAPKYPDWNADFGIHEFTYSFLPHTGCLADSDVMAEAARLNRPPLLLPGLAGKLSSPIHLEAKNVVLAAFKKAEKEECRIIRLVEIAGQYSEARLYTRKKLIETDLLEWNDGETIKTQNDEIKLKFKPFEIKTFKIY